MRIFISHGTDKANPDELAFLDTLEQSLRTPAPGMPAHEVLLDRTRLEAGDDWQGVLEDWLAECQLAILLLSPRALTRPWVLKEATILAFRRSQEAGFVLLPLLLPGVSAGALAAQPGFSALRLDAVQAFGAGSTAAFVGAFVQQKLATIQPPLYTPLDRLQQVLENRIGQANAQAIEQVCEDLLGETVVWSAPLDRVRQRARVIARAITRGRLGRVCTLTALTKALRDAALAQEQCREVLDLAASLWVDAEVAARLRAAFADAGGVPRAVALNSGRVRHGARMAVWRAQIPDTAENVYWVAGGGSDGWSSELAERMCAAYFAGNKGQIFDLDEARDVLSVRTERVVFVVPPPLPDEWLLEELHDQFPSAVFIAHTGGELPPSLPAHIAPLSPGLRLDLEKANHADYVAAHESLRK
jgi:hypothetical protein